MQSAVGDQHLLALKLETHRLYAELEQQRRLAALGTLVSALAHDIRTPLTAIRMNAQLLQKRAERLGADAESVAIVITEVDRLGELVGNMLDFSRPIALAPGIVEVHSLLYECVRQVTASGAGTEVGVQLEVAADVGTLPGDRVLTAHLRNDGLHPLRVDIGDVRLLDSSGRVVASTPVFLETFGKSLWAAGRGPQQVPDTELLRTGRIALLKPGQEVPLTIAWHDADGDPVRVDYKRGSLGLPG